MKQHLLGFLLGVTIGVGLSSITTFAAHAGCRPEAQASDLPAASKGLEPFVTPAAFARRFAASGTPLAGILRPLALATGCRRHQTSANARGTDDDGQLAEIPSLRHGLALTKDRGVN